VRTKLRAIPAGEGEVLLELDPGELFEMLDDSAGWAWGYAGKHRRVGYVKSNAIGST
jgi:hypothetical protein